MPPRNLPRAAPSTRTVFLFIKERLDAGQDWPTGIEISRHMGWSYSGSYRDCLSRLVRRGVIEYASKRKINAKDWSYSYRLTGKEFD